MIIPPLPRDYVEAAPYHAARNAMEREQESKRKPLPEPTVPIRVFGGNRPTYRNILSLSPQEVESLKHKQSKTGQ